jgi:hypothetical protein
LQGTFTLLPEVLLICTLAILRLPLFLLLSPLLTVVIVGTPPRFVIVIIVALPILIVSLPILLLLARANVSVTLLLILLLTLLIVLLLLTLLFPALLL